MAFTLDNLSETEFEDYSYDLLKSLNFKNINWRKGTGLSSSPADQGRDIECELHRREVDGNEYLEKWFVECKHYKKGVPADKINGAITWAMAERPNVLLIIVSNFLSNSAKNYLKQYQDHNNPPFRIKVWELKDLENLTIEKSALLSKYKLAPDLNLLDSANKLHIAYAIRPVTNTVNYLIELMDALDPELRDQAFAMTYFEIINPNFRSPKNEKETMGDLLTEPVDYESFREKCIAHGDGPGQNFAPQIVKSMLSWCFHYSDKSRLAELMSRNEDIHEYLERQIELATSAKEIDFFSNMLNKHKKFHKQLPEQTKACEQIYTNICNELVRKLLAEKPTYFNTMDK